MEYKSIAGKILHNTQQIKALNEELVPLVEAARENGYSWEDIGRLQGITAQGAQQKHARHRTSID